MSTAPPQDPQGVVPETPADDVFVFPASYSQQRLWFLDQLQPGSGAYNIPSAFRFRGVLDASALERSLNEVIARHESLRTTFSSDAGVPVQVVSPSLVLPLPVEDLSSATGREAEMERIVLEAAAAPFDLKSGPLVRARLLRLGPEEHVFFLNVHHIVVDGLSTAVIFAEMSALYAAFVAGRPSPLPEMSIQFADYAVWQQGFLQGSELGDHLDYWRKQLGGPLPLVELPSDRPRSAEPTGKGHRYRRPVATKEVAEALAALCRKEKTTPFAGLLAAFALLVQRYTGQDDILLGSPFANRSRSEIEESVGFYAATVVLRTDVSGDPTFRELVARAREVVLGAYANQDVPFEKVVETLRPDRDRAHNPFFQIMLGFQTAPEDAMALPGIEVELVDSPHQDSMFDLLVQLVETRDGHVGYFTYSSDLYDGSTVLRFTANYERLLAAAVAQPDQPVSRLPILTDAERERILVDWNATNVPVKETTVHALFAEQVARTPDAVAVRFADQALSYRELDARANRLAHELRANGVGPDGLVGLCLERSLDLVVGVLGTLKAGGAYLPLDPTYPKDRLAFMIADSQVPVLVCHERTRAELPAGAVRVVSLEALAATPAGDPGSSATASNLAYVIYTSGSTGKPKGVQLEHRNVTNFFAAMDERVGAGPGVWLAVTSLSFDISVLELLWTLTRGFTVVLQADGDKTAGFAAQVAAHGVTHFQCTPSMAGLLVGDHAARPALASLQKMLVGGEALSGALAADLRKALRGPLLNMYGPTETTIWSSTSIVEDDLITIGRPVANTTFYVVDGNRAPVPVGVAGELLIGGAGVARGYLGRPELTAERFVPNPFGEGRLYRTGDLARYRADGAVEFLGRIDHQVKIRGHRIELGEIEALLRELPDVREAVVVAREDQPGDKRLVAYLVGAVPPVADLRRLLRERLPEPMVPAAFVTLERLPQTPNGKIDRKALPAPEVGRTEEQDAPVAPRTPTEQVVAEIWQEVLGIPKVSIFDNFFDLGGHSLLSAKVVYHIEKRLQKRLSVAELILQNLAQVASKCDQTKPLDESRGRGVLGALKRMISKG